jgi:hypothetical protein
MGGHEIWIVPVVTGILTGLSTGTQAALDEKRQKRAKEKSEKFALALEDRKEKSEEKGRRAAAQGAQTAQRKKMGAYQGWSRLFASASGSTAGYTTTGVGTKKTLLGV